MAVEDVEINVPKGNGKNKRGAACAFAEGLHKEGAACAAAFIWSDDEGELLELD